MSELYGIDEIQKLMPVAYGLGNTLGNILEDKKWELSETPQLLALFPSLTVFASLDYAKLKNQFKDISAEEKTQLVTDFKTGFNLPESLDKIEEIIELGLTSMDQLGTGIYSIIEFAKKIKELKEAPSA